MIFQFVKGLKEQKNGLKCQKFLSVTPYISGTIYHMIFIYGTCICRHFFHFFQNLDIQDQSDKNICLSHSVSQELYVIWLWFLVHMCKMIISLADFFIFQNFGFLGFLRRWRAKNDLKLPISVCFAQYLRNCSSYHRDFDNDIYRYFPLFIF